MSSENLLVAEVTDNTSAVSGAYLLEDAADIARAIESGDWGAGALAAASGALDTAAAVIDPIGTLIANGLGWVLDHVEPLKSWFNDFTGDAAEVAAFSQTWANAGNHLHDVASAYQSSLSHLDELSGATIEAYFAHAKGMIAHLHGTGDWAGAMATGLQLASTLVQLVHDLVRDALSQIVGTAISAIGLSVATVGLGIPAAAAQVGARAASLASRLGRIIPQVIDALTELKRLLGKLAPAISRAVDNLTELLRGGGHTPHIAILIRRSDAMPKQSLIRATL